MKKLLALVAVAAALTACSKKEEAPAVAPAPVAAAVPASAASAPAAPTASAADLPQACSDYLAKVQACAASQSGAVADTMKSSLAQTQSTWASIGSDKAALAQACKAASDAFATQATALKC